MITTVVLLGGAVLVALVVGRLAGRRVDNPDNRYYLRKAIHGVVRVGGRIQMGGVRGCSTACATVHRGASATQEIIVYRPRADDG